MSLQSSFDINCNKHPPIPFSTFPKCGDYINQPQEQAKIPWSYRKSRKFKRLKNQQLSLCEKLNLELTVAATKSCCLIQDQATAWYQKQRELRDYVLGERRAISEYDFRQIPANLDLKSAIRDVAPVEQDVKGPSYMSPEFQELLRQHDERIKETSFLYNLPKEYTRRRYKRLVKKKEKEIVSKPICSCTKLVKELKKTVANKSLEAKQKTSSKATSTKKKSLCSWCWWGKKKGSLDEFEETKDLNDSNLEELDECTCARDYIKQISETILQEDPKFNKETIDLHSSLWVGSKKVEDSHTKREVAVKSSTKIPKEDAADAKTSNHRNFQFWVHNEKLPKTDSRSLKSSNDDLSSRNRTHNLKIKSDKILKKDMQFKDSKTQLKDHKPQYLLGQIERHKIETRPEKISVKVRHPQDSKTQLKEYKPQYLLGHDGQHKTDYRFWVGTKTNCFTERDKPKKAITVKRKAKSPDPFPAERPKVVKELKVEEKELKVEEKKPKVVKDVKVKEEVEKPKVVEELKVKEESDKTKSKSLTKPKEEISPVLKPEAKSQIDELKKKPVNKESEVLEKTSQDLKIQLPEKKQISAKDDEKPIEKKRDKTEKNSLQPEKKIKTETKKSDQKLAKYRPRVQAPKTDKLFHLKLSRSDQYLSNYRPRIHAPLSKLPENKMKYKTNESQQKITNYKPRVRYYKVKTRTKTPNPSPTVFQIVKPFAKSKKLKKRFSGGALSQEVLINLSPTNTVKEIWTKTNLDQLNESDEDLENLTPNFNKREADHETDSEESVSADEVMFYTPKSAYVLGQPNATKRYPKKSLKYKEYYKDPRRVRSGLDAANEIQSPRIRQDRKIFSKSQGEFRASLESLDYSNEDSPRNSTVRQETEERLSWQPRIHVKNASSDIDLVFSEPEKSTMNARGFRLLAAFVRPKFKSKQLPKEIERRAKSLGNSPALKAGSSSKRQSIKNNEVDRPKLSQVEEKKDTCTCKRSKGQDEGSARYSLKNNNVDNPRFPQAIERKDICTCKQSKYQDDEKTRYSFNGNEVGKSQFSDVMERKNTCTCKQSQYRDDEGARYSVKSNEVDNPRFSQTMEKNNTCTCKQSQYQDDERDRHSVKSNEVDNPRFSQTMEKKNTCTCKQSQYQDDERARCSVKSNEVDNPKFSEVMERKDTCTCNRSGEQNYKNTPTFFENYSTNLNNNHKSYVDDQYYKDNCACQRSEYQDLKRLPDVSCSYKSDIYDNNDPTSCDCHQTNIEGFPRKSQCLDRMLEENMPNCICYQPKPFNGENMQKTFPCNKTYNNDDCRYSKISPTTCECLKADIQGIYKDFKCPEYNLRSCKPVCTYGNLIPFNTERTCEDFERKPKCFDNNRAKLNRDVKKSPPCYNAKFLNDINLRRSCDISSIYGNEDQFVKKSRTCNSFNFQNNKNFEKPCYNSGLRSSKFSGVRSTCLSINLQGLSQFSERRPQSFSRYRCPADGYKRPQYSLRCTENDEVKNKLRQSQSCYVTKPCGNLRTSRISANKTQCLKTGKSVSWPSKIQRSKNSFTCPKAFGSQTWQVKQSRYGPEHDKCDCTSLSYSKICQENLEACENERDLLDINECECVNEADSFSKVCENHEECLDDNKCECDSSSVLEYCDNIDPTPFKDNNVCKCELGPVTNCDETIRPFKEDNNECECEDENEISSKSYRNRGHPLETSECNCEQESSNNYKSKCDCDREAPTSYKSNRNQGTPLDYNECECENESPIPSKSYEPKRQSLGNNKCECANESSKPFPFNGNQRIHLDYNECKCESPISFKFKRNKEQPLTNNQCKCAKEISKSSKFKCDCDNESPMSYNSNRKQRKLLNNNECEGNNESSMSSKSNRDKRQSLGNNKCECANESFMTSKSKCNCDNENPKSFKYNKTKGKTLDYNECECNESSRSSKSYGDKRQPLEKNECKCANKNTRSSKCNCDNENSRSFKSIKRKLTHSDNKECKCSNESSRSSKSDANKCESLNNKNCECDNENSGSSKSNENKTEPWNNKTCECAYENPQSSNFNRVKRDSVDNTECKCANESPRSSKSNENKRESLNINKCDCDKEVLRSSKSYGNKRVSRFSKSNGNKSESLINKCECDNTNPRSSKSKENKKEDNTRSSESKRVKRESIDNKECECANESPRSSKSNIRESLKINECDCDKEILRSSKSYGNKRESLKNNECYCDNEIPRYSCPTKNSRRLPENEECTCQTNNSHKLTQNERCTCPTSDPRRSWTMERLPENEDCTGQTKNFRRFPESEKCTCQTKNSSRLPGYEECSCETNIYRRFTKKEECNYPTSNFRRSRTMERLRRNEECPCPTTNSRRSRNMERCAYNEECPSPFSKSRRSRTIERLRANEECPCPTPSSRRSRTVERWPNNKEYPCATTNFRGSRTMERCPNIEECTCHAINYPYCKTFQRFSENEKCSCQSNNSCRPRTIERFSRVLERRAQSCPCDRLKSNENGCQKISPKLQNKRQFLQFKEICPNQKKTLQNRKGHTACIFDNTNDSSFQASVCTTTCIEEIPSRKCPRIKGGSSSKTDLDKSEKPSKTKNKLLKLPKCCLGAREEEESSESDAKAKSLENKNKLLALPKCCFGTQEEDDSDTKVKSARNMNKLLKLSKCCLGTLEIESETKDKSVEDLEIPSSLKEEESSKQSLSNTELQEIKETKKRCKLPPRSPNAAKYTRPVNISKHHQICFKDAHIWLGVSENYPKSYQELGKSQQIENDLWTKRRLKLWGAYCPKTQPAKEFYQAKKLKTVQDATFAHRKCFRDSSPYKKSKGGKEFKKRAIKCSEMEECKKRAIKCSESKDKAKEQGNRCQCLHRKRHLEE